MLWENPPNTAAQSNSAPLVPRTTFSPMSDHDASSHLAHISLQYIACRRCVGLRLIIPTKTHALPAIGVTKKYIYVPSSTAYVCTIQLSRAAHWLLLRSRRGAVAVHIIATLPPCRNFALVDPQHLLLVRSAVAVASCLPLALRCRASRHSRSQSLPRLLRRLPLRCPPCAPPVAPVLGLRLGSRVAPRHAV